VDLALFSDDGGGCTCTLVGPFDVVGSPGLEPSPLLSVASVAAAEEAAPSASDDDVGGGNTGPCSSGGGDVMLLALDMSSRLVDSRRADEDSLPVMKFSSLSTQASW